MAFDPEKDKVLKKWRCEETGLVISINQYGDGDPKLQIGPRVFVKKMEQSHRERRGVFRWRICRGFTNLLTM